MKKSFLIVIAIIVSSLSLCGSSSAQYQKNKVAVLDFQLQGDGFQTTDMGSIVAEWLITALVKEGRFDVVERRLLQKLVAEQKLALTGLVDARGAVKLGKVLGVKIIISGSVMKFQNILEVNARIIDVESGSIIAAESVKSSTAKRLEDLVVQMAEIIIRDFPLEGYVVSRKGNSISVDLGKRTGVKEGMQFLVFKEGDVIKHPRTGEVLDVETIETGKIEINSVSDNLATARIMEESSRNSIKYGQHIKSISGSSTLIGKYFQPLARAIIPGQTASVNQPAGIEEVDAKFEEAKRLKDAGDANWKLPFREATMFLKQELKKNKKSPLINLYFAKVYLLEDKYGKAVKYIDKAISYDKNYLEAFILKGDICHEWGKLRPRSWGKVEKWGVQAYSSAAKISSDNNVKAMMSYKTGNLYADISANKKAAVRNWKRAVSIAPDSEAARLARESL
ncbi:MAG: FlgO family outer membrane protein [bacterium]|nr:FlgO family outer membrane protein [bacterium]